MRHRGLLHTTRLPAFVAWAFGRGWRTAPTVGPDEVVRLVRRAGRRCPPVVLTKRRGAAHLTTSGEGLELARAFLGNGGARG